MIRDKEAQAEMLSRIPRDFEVIAYTVAHPNLTTCGTCGLSWDDRVSTGSTPAPSGRCPFEPWHPDEDPDEEIDVFEVVDMLEVVDVFVARCADALIDNATGFTCGEAESIAAVLAVTSPESAAGFLAAHARGDEPDDAHYPGGSDD